MPGIADEPPLAPGPIGAGSHDEIVVFSGPMSRHINTPVLERLLEPVSESLNVEAAKKLVGLKADARSQARVDELARKANEGSLTADEKAEYETYIAAGNLIAVLQAKARHLLAA